MALHPVSRVRLSTQIENQLKDQILTGMLKPGERLPSENELAEIFKVSRVSIRQALQSLAAQGLIETRIGDGSFISQPNIGIFMQDVIPDVYLTDDSLRAVLEFRMLFEGPVAELAATRGTDEQIEELAVLYNQMLNYEDDPSKNSYYDLSFHMLIGEMTGNPMVTGVYRILNGVMRSSWNKVATSQGPRMGFYYHKKLLDAFRSRDPVLCREVMDEHIRNSWQLIFGSEDADTSASV